MAPPVRSAPSLVVLVGALLAASVAPAQQRLAQQRAAQQQQLQWPEHPSRAEAVELAQQAAAAMQAKDWVRAAETSQRLAVICQEELADQPAYEAMAQNYLGIAHAWLGDHKAGLEAMVRSAELYEQTLPPGSPHLQTVYDSGRDAAFAAQDWDVAWHFEEKMNGLFEQHADPAVVDARLWESAERWANYRQARPALKLARRRARRITERAGAQPADAVAALQRVAYIAMRLSEHETAIAQLRPLLPVVRKLGLEQAPLKMAVLNELGEALRALARWKEAAPLYDEAFAGLSNDNAEHWDALATLHNNRGLNQKMLGDLEGAAEDLTRAVFFRRQLAADDGMLAYPLNNRGNLYREMGLLDAAQRDLRAALRLRRQHDGDGASTTATTLLNLGLVAFMKTDHVKAERLFTAAYRRYLELLGPDHPDTANAMMSIARLRQVRGEIQKANELYLVYVKPVVDKLPAGHPYRTAYQEFVVDLFVADGNYKEARRWAERALNETVEVRGANTLDAAMATYQLAGLDWAAGARRQAKVRATRALEVLRKAGAQSAGLRAQILIERASWDIEEEAYDRARRRLDDAIAIGSAEEGNNWLLADAEMRLSQVDWLQGHADGALAHLRASKEHIDDASERWMMSGSLGDRQRFSRHYVWQLDLAVHYAHARPDGIEARRLLAELMIAFRGVAVAASAQRFQQVRRSPQARDYLAGIAALRRQLAAIALGDRQASDEERYELEQRLERFERTLATLHTGHAFDVRPPSLVEVQRALPPGGRFIDYVVLMRDGEPDTLWAVSFGASGEVDFRSVGAADALLELAGELRRLAGDPSSRLSAIKRRGRKLHAALLPPAVAGEDDGPLIVAPTQAFNVMPWAALVDGEGRWLVDARQIVLTLGARELVRRGSVAGSDALIVAAPTFGEAGEGLVRRWSPLPGTEQEAAALAKLMPDATVLTGPAASERALTSIRGPRVLHLATHGYFFAPKDAPPDEGVRLASARGFKVNFKGKKVPQSARPAGAATPGRATLDGDALLRSGLVLAGANEQAAEDDDGLLTGLEASGLDLGGTELAVLSACETGLGDFEPGYGVAGLRRAFAIAGARSQVMSLWSVDDDATRQLMERFYTGVIKEGAPRGEALRRAQQAVMRTEGYEHPYYWAAFILSGDWRPLPEAAAAR